MDDKHTPNAPRTKLREERRKRWSGPSKISVIFLVWLAVGLATVVSNILTVSVPYALSPICRIKLGLVQQAPFCHSSIPTVAEQFSGDEQAPVQFQALTSLQLIFQRVAEEGFGYERVIPALDLTDLFQTMAGLSGGKWFKFDNKRVGPRIDSPELDTLLNNVGLMLNTALKVGKDASNLQESDKTAARNLLLLTGKVQAKIQQESEKRHFSRVVPQWFTKLRRFNIFYIFTPPIYDGSALGQYIVLTTAIRKESVLVHLQAIELVKDLDTVRRLVKEVEGYRNVKDLSKLEMKKLDGMLDRAEAHILNALARARRTRKLLGEVPHFLDEIDAHLMARINRGQTTTMDAHAGDVSFGLAMLNNVWFEFSNDYGYGRNWN